MDRDQRSLSMKDIFLACSNLSRDRRSRYLDEHCPDPALRREVELMLDARDATNTLPADRRAPGFTSQGLSVGARFGHYTVRRKLGAGGMGWVYEAIDEKLHRTVAIKVLAPGEIGEDQRKRFAREAQSASALNHPNIVTVYEVGREEDIDFIAMECIAGETLRTLIGPRGLDVPTALRYASQIADALAAAHEVGIVHRDLKPGNVMVTERGLVKVLDFGLAKQSRRPHSGQDPTPAETTLSELGHVIGTVSYMSPEQAEGKPVDTRSDIFSFGSLFFEILTGRRAFEDDSHIGTMAAILKNEPRIADLPQSLPRGIERIIRKCLAKKPADRWQHISDVRIQIDDILKDLETPLPAQTPSRSMPRRTFGWPVVIGACLAGALLTSLLLRTTRLSGPAAVQSSEPILRMVTADTGLSSYPALSRDGRLLAFASDRSNEGNLDIWLQQVGGRNLIRLTSDPADESQPAFSPDGTRIAFRSEREGGGVYVVSALGGESPILLASDGRDPRFSPDGKWIAYWIGRGSQYAPGLSHMYIIESGGGVPRAVHPEMSAAYLPIWSPRGSELLVVGQSNEGLDWFVVPLDNSAPVRKTGALRQIRSQGLAEVQLPNVFRPTPLEWTGDAGDRILFSCALGDVANLWEIDLSTDWTVSGAARRITRGPGRQVRASRAGTGDGVRTMFADEKLDFDIWSLNVDPDAGIPRGEPKRLTDEDSPEWAPAISADGLKLAFLTRRGGVWLLRTRDLATRAENTVISSSVPIVNAKLTGDGTRIVYSTTDYGLFSVARGGGAASSLCQRCGTLMGISFDGTKATYEPVENEDLYVFDVGAGKSRKLADRHGERVILSSGQLSPDERWVAFHSQQSPAGTTQVWIAPVQDGRTASRDEWISMGERESRDRDPSWASGGNMLYFLSDRDGFRCIWARRLEARTKYPAGAAFAVRHFHSARQSLQHLGYLTGLSLGGGQLVFALGELTANIWSLEAPGREIEAQR